jgi:predicted RNA-binding protein
VEMGMIPILEMEDVIYSSVAKEKIQLQTLMKLKEI